MDSYRNKYSSRHHESRHHKHKHRHRHHHYRYGDEEDYESHRVHQRHHNHRSSDEDGEYQYNQYKRVPSERIEKPPSPMYIPVKRPATPPPPPAIPIIEKPKEPNWKLMVDPFITKAPTKVYRYDGVMANDPSYPELVVQDPRSFKSKNKTITLPIELTVPKFKVCILNK